MADNVTFQTDQRAWPPDGMAVETEQQPGGAHRQVVKVASSALPSGAATAAAQADLLTELQRKADLTETQPVSAASLPLPSGAATSANQTNGDQVAKVLFDSSNMSAFGTLETAEPEPVIQTDFVYGLNTQIWQTAVVSGTGAAVDTNAGRLRIQSGTGAAGYAYVQTRRPVRYRAGQGQIARFTPLFTTGAANNIQLWGMGSIVSNAPHDGYFFGYNGTAFGICHYIAGTPYWTAQTSWNGDKCDGTAGTAFNYNPTFGTPAMIKYPYLGYGDIEFFLQNPSTGRWVLVHVIRYANTTATLQLTNPTLQFLGFTLNSGNTSNRIMYCGSVGVFISGVRSFIGNPKWAADITKTGITTEALALSIRNCTTYNTVTNRGLIRIHSVGIGTNTNTYGVLRFRIGATITGSPVYNPISGSTADSGVTITSGNSIASVDTAGTLTAGSGTYIWNMPIGASSSALMDVTPFNIFIAPGEILSITLTAANALSSNVSVNWTEDI